ncbi:hypothetical protein [Natrinema versiforme]|uniref:Uncharacterized protein n=1 Tax=Natrinema versiforme JCM 10478 TaxID=1227496 RepID=L9Y599_9EURY|nr:hypothetical protein [Natrinema versiforme]ELY68902.1 hypothetical protein C489_06033 [Natrinema versiforme JCM 10478]
MTDRSDPLDDFEPPPLAEQVDPYRGYGDTELALSLLAFHKQHAMSVGALGYETDRLSFDVRCRPADTGANYHCPDCEEPVRGVSKPGEGVLSCPLCGETPGALVLGKGVDDG